MFSRLVIKGFQKHKKLKIDLDKVTSIVGASDTGKSAIIRAIRWVCENSPRGTAFISHDLKKCEVGLTVDGLSIVRSRSKSKNEYFLDKKEFKAFGNDVPAQIKSLINVSDINFQGQHDSAFWLSASAGEVSRSLNEIVDLSIVDRTLSNLASRKRKVGARLEVEEEKLDKLKVQKRALRKFVEMDKDLKGLEGLSLALVQLDDKKDRLSRDLHEIEELQKDTNREPLIVASRLASLAEEVEEKKRYRSRLIGLLKRVSATVPEAPPIDRIRGLERLAIGLKEARRKRRELSSSLSKIEQVKELSVDYERKSAEAQKRLESMIGETCPLCGNSKK